MVHPLHRGNGRPADAWEAAADLGCRVQDKPENAAGLLKHAGNPYARIGSDREGRVAIDWGVSGVPESFLIAPGGMIVWHSAAGLDSPEVRDSLKNALKAVGG